MFYRYKFNYIYEGSLYLINNIKNSKIFDKGYLQDIDTSGISDMRDEKEFDDK